MITPFLPSDPGAPVAPALYDIVDSPVGRLLLTGDEQALTGLYMLDAGSHSATVQPGWTRRPGGFGVAAAQLGEYFAGSRKEFDLPLAPRGTPFQLSVWEELARIPFGVTMSYGEVAAHSKSLQRQGGQARQQAEPDLDHPAVSPGDRCGRLADRLRLGPGPEGVAAPPRGRARRVGCRGRQGRLRGRAAHALVSGRRQPGSSGRAA
jgi:hypothetical protein